MRTPPGPYIGGRSGPSWLEGWAHIIARESSAAPKCIVYASCAMRHVRTLCVSGVPPATRQIPVTEGLRSSRDVLTFSLDMLSVAPVFCP